MFPEYTTNSSKWDDDKNKNNNNNNEDNPIQKMHKWLDWPFYKRVYLNEQKKKEKENPLNLINQREMQIKPTLCIFKHSPKWVK